MSKQLITEDEMKSVLGGEMVCFNIPYEQVCYRYDYYINGVKYTGINCELVGGGIVCA